MDCRPAIASAETALTTVAALMVEGAATVMILAEDRWIGMVTQRQILRQVLKHNHLVGIMAISAIDPQVQPVNLSDLVNLSELELQQQLQQWLSWEQERIPVLDDDGHLVGAIAPQGWLIECNTLTCQSEANSPFQAESQSTKDLPQTDDTLRTFSQPHAHSSLCDRRNQATEQSASIERRMLEAIPDLLIRMDRDGNYRDFVPAKDLAILEPRYMPGINAREVIPLDIAEQRIYAARRALQTGITQSYEYQLWINGQRYDREDRVVAIAEDEVVVAVRDISDRKMLEYRCQQTEAALSESETRFRNLADAAPMLVWLADAQGLCVFVSQGWLNFTGRTFEQEQGNGWIENIHPADTEQALKIYWDAFHSQIPYSAEYRLRRADGEYRWVLDQGVPRFLSDGRFAGYVVSCIDISDRKQAEEALKQSEERLSLHFQNTPLAVIEWDNEFRVLEWNAAATRMFGYTRQEVLGRHGGGLLVPQDMRPQVMKLWQTLIQGQGGTRSTNYNLTKDGRTIVCEWYNTPLRDSNGKIIGVASLALDISDRINTEIALQEANERLERRVMERTGALRRVNAQLTQEIADRKRMQQILQESQNCLRLINSISTGLTTGMTIDQIIEATILQLNTYFGQVRVVYSTIDQDAQLKAIYSTEIPGLPEIRGTTADLAIAPDFFNTMCQLSPVIIADVNTDPIVAPLRELLLSEGTQALLDVPLRHSQVLVGLLSLESPYPHTWTEYEIATLIEVADYLSIVLQEAHTREERHRAEAELLRSQKRNALLATALEEAGDGIEITNAEGVIEYVNSAIEEITGYSRQELIGKPSAEIFRDKQSSNSSYQAIQATLTAGQVWRGNLLIRRKEGTPCFLESTISPVVDEQGLVIHYVSVKRDITARKRVEESLRLTQFSLDHAVDAAFWIQPDGKFTYVNKAACRSLGYTYVELLLMSIRDISPYLPVSAWTHYWQELKQQGFLRFETYHRTKRGQFFPVEFTINYLEFNGREYGFAFARDLTSRRQAEEALRLRDQAITASSNGIIITDARQTDFPVIYVNPAFEQQTGYASGEVVGRNCRFLQGSDRDQESVKTLREAIRNQRGCTAILRNYRKDGTLFWNELSISPIFDSNGTLTHYIGIQNDISDRIQAEHVLRASLEEKDLLLREVHHRVKNNLQVISSIFSLQAQYNDDPEILSLLADSQNRIRSMALIHEKLYQSKSLAQIDFTDYIRNLVSNLFSSYNVSANLVRLKLDICALSLNIDTAIPCGLLINELVSNALKHAFPNERPGEIRIVLEEIPENQLHLVIRDDGIGLPDGLELQQSNSLGLRLVRALTRQLVGTMNAYTDGGAVFELTFPIPQERKRF